MINWNNLDTLNSYRKLADAPRIDLVAAMTGENGAKRVKDFSVPMACGLSYNYAAKEVDDTILSNLSRIGKNLYEYMRIFKYL